MKRFFLSLVCAVTFAGCVTKGVTHHTAPVAAPSVDNVKAKVTEAQVAVDQANVSVAKANAALDEANKASERLQKRLENAQNFSKRIDNKATVILQNWK